MTFIKEDFIKMAIMVSHGFGMDEVVLSEAVYNYLNGQCDPVLVLSLVRKYLANGHRFPLE